ncbi:hypothetical protein WNY78_09430 [Psychroserpens sp. AS72]|uniref:TapB family protein n=1 Tax=Psychroserpens sp. AS72 TaxID=3135775 RepID=UPI0031790AD8
MIQKISILVLITLCLSCSSDDSIAPETQNSNFYALTVGNSWMYENFQYNEEYQTYEETGVIDNITITSIENILGDDYYIYKTVTTGNDDEIPFCNPNGEKEEYIRAYEGYLIDNTSRIRFVNNVFEPILDREYSNGSLYFQLEQETETVTTTAGTFECQKMYRYFDHNEEGIWNGRHYFYYANGVGLVMETPTSFAAEIPNIEKRLISYNVQ